MRRVVAFVGDDRAVSSAVTHALALGITAILISGLLLSASTLLQDQRQNASREELRTVGNRIASELTRAAALAQAGGNVTIRTQHPRTIAGQTYQVTLLTGSACQTHVFTADTCLSLETQDGTAHVMVPVRNETAVSLDASTGGTFVISSTRNASAPPTALPAFHRDLRVGVGKDVEEYTQGSVLNITNRNPISGFTFSPGRPTVDSTIHFENDTKDLDGVITNYEWDLGDGTTKTGVREFNYSYASPGKYTVTLTVTDNDGATDNVSKVVSVGGLRYNDDAVAQPLTGSGPDDAVGFSVTNLHSTDIEIQQVLIDPSNDSLKRLSSGWASSDELEVDAASGGTDGGYGSPVTLYTDGGIVDLEKNSGTATLPGGSTADVWLRGFEDGSGNRANVGSEPVFVAMRYRVGGEYYTSQFRLFGGGGGASAPSPAFTYSCSDRDCSFDATGSSASAGIKNYSWTFGDGSTASGPSASTPSHTYAANGTYDVVLTVTDNNDVSSSVTKSVTVGSSDGVVVWAVNSGGSSYTDSNGITYQRDDDCEPNQYLSDRYFAHYWGSCRYESYGTSTYQTGYSIDNTNDDPLYQTERWGSTVGYDVPVANGQYEVTFDLAEIYWNDPNQRIFDVGLEGNTVVSNLDIYSQVGNDHAMQLTRTVTVTDGVLNIRFDDATKDNPKSSAIVVRRLNAQAFQEADGTPNELSMEAEHYMGVAPGNHDNVYGDDMSNDQWNAFSDAQASGGTGLVAQPDNGDNAQDTKNGERLDYYADFTDTGTYNVWVRMKCSGGSADSVHVGLDGTPVTYGDVGLTANSTTSCSAASGWMWASYADGSRASVDVTAPGQHTVNLWMREDGTKIDKVVLRKSTTAPTGVGPSESALG